jgi:hypothetical protein
MNIYGSTLPQLAAAFAADDGTTFSASGDADIPNSTLLETSLEAMPGTSTATLTGRDRAILRAVAAGGAELLIGAEPDLLLDGRCCCDQVAAHRLTHAGLIAPTLTAGVGQRVPACLTPAGAARLIA